MEWVADNSNGRRRVSRDDIRYAVYGVYSGAPINEQLVTVIENQQVENALVAGLDVVIDATNLNAKNVRRFSDVAKKHNYEVEIKDFKVSLEEAILRDSRRDKSVGEEVIKSFFVRYIKDGKLPEVRTERAIS
jgi:predicted kinase